MLLNFDLTTEIIVRSAVNYPQVGQSNRSPSGEDELATIVLSMAKLSD